MVDSASDRPTVVLTQGTVKGVKQSSPFPKPVETFLGIPYAAPPTGDRRFRLAEPVAPSTDVIDASKFGPIAPAKQLFTIGPKLDSSEDCLTVNVFRQEPTEETKLLPVAIYIHGGAFNRGSASMHNTASMVGWSAAPFIAVSFNYRIGALGFLPSKLSQKEGILNLGLKDQILLFHWVQENIKSFGGDPKNVTLIGLSAGAHSIGHHLLNYEEGKKPLFQRVVIESGAPTSRAVRSFDSTIHEQQFQEFLEVAGCPSDISESEILPFLRSLPIDTIAKAQETVFYSYNPSLRWAFQPVQGDDIIRHRPIDAWKSGKWHKVPILTGFNTNEGSLYVNKKMDRSEEFREFFKTLLPQLESTDLDTIETLYPDPSTNPESPYKDTREGVGAQYKRIEAAYAHYAYCSPVRQTAHLASSEAPVYLYHWALETTIIGGASHADNMRYEVQDPGVHKLSPSQKELSGTIHAYITSFICTGDPNHLTGAYPERPQWPKYQNSNPKIMIFGQKNKELVGGSVGPPAEVNDDIWAKEESDFWWSKVGISQQ
ncbi:putative Carboxylic ester hydrolase [Seiridium cardinale]